jgi:Ca2+-binding EF-hand superfamily protein
VQVDEDNSGSIDFDEFLTMMKKKMMENDRRSEDVRAAFQVFDQVQLSFNSDGIFSLSKGRISTS